MIGYQIVHRNTKKGAAYTLEIEKKRKLCPQPKFFPNKITTYSGRNTVPQFMLPVIHWVLNTVVLRTLDLPPLKNSLLGLLLWAITSKLTHPGAL